MNKYEDLKLTRVEGVGCDAIEVMGTKISKYNDSEDYKLVECGFRYFNLNEEGYNDAKTFADNLTMEKFDTDNTLFEDGDGWLTDKHGTFINSEYYDNGQYEYMWVDKHTCMLLLTLNNNKHVMAIYSYDTMGRLLYVRRNDTAGYLIESIENYYNKDGRLENTVITTGTLGAVSQVKIKYNESNNTSIEHHYVNGQMTHIIRVQWDETFTHKLYQYVLDCSKVIDYHGARKYNHIESITKFEYGEDGSEYTFERRNPRKFLEYKQSEAIK